MGISKRIKEAREMMGLTQKELADRLGVTASAVTNYENGTSHPKEPVLLKMLEILPVDANFLFQDDIKSPKREGYTHQEKLLIKKYRTLDGHGKRTVDVVLEEEVQRMEEMRKAEEKKVLKPKAAVIDLRRYWESPSAGNGNDLTDGGYDIIQVPDTLTARLASYALTVSGDSMEPDLMDGDIVLVKAQEVYEIGDIVVFSKNGESYIKYAGEHCFESANPDYPDIVIGEDDSVRCFGVVLGKL